MPGSHPPVPPASGHGPAPPGRAAALAELAGRLVERLREDAWSAGPGGEVPGRIAALVEREAGVLPAAARAELAAFVERSALGAGPLQPLLDDPGVDEILVHGDGAVWVERAGRLERTAVRAGSEADVRGLIERLLAPAGRRVDEAEPLCDARLPDGSRVNVVLPPLAVDGPAVTIRRFRPRGMAPEDLVAAGTLTEGRLALLAAAVRERRSILICGGTGSGKTTTLGALSAFIGAEERVVTIEDTAELLLRREHVVRLEARPPGVDGRGEVTIRDLLRNALRMRPDRIVVGEVRGAEALDMVQAMATGHAGSMSSVHAGSPAEALRRVETLALMAGTGLSLEAVRRQVAGALDLVVQQVRDPDGGRRITAIAEVVEQDSGVALLREAMPR